MNKIGQTLRDIGETFRDPYFYIPVLISTVSYSVAAVALGVLSFPTLPLVPAALLGAATGGVLWIAYKPLLSRAVEFFDLQAPEQGEMRKVLSILVDNLVVWTTALVGIQLLGSPLTFSATAGIILTHYTLLNLLSLTLATFSFIQQKLQPEESTLSPAPIEDLSILNISVGSLISGFIEGASFALSAEALRLLGFQTLPLLPSLLLGIATGISAGLVKNLIIPLVEQHLDRTKESHQHVLIALEAFSGFVAYVGLPFTMTHFMGAPFTLSATLLTASSARTFKTIVIPTLFFSLDAINAWKWLGPLFDLSFYQSLLTAAATYSVSALVLGALSFPTLPLLPAALLGATSAAVIYLTEDNLVPLCKEFLNLDEPDTDILYTAANAWMTWTTALLAIQLFGSPFTFAATAVVVSAQYAVSDLFDLAIAVKNFVRIKFQPTEKKLQPHALKDLSVQQIGFEGLIMGGSMATCYFVASLALRTLGLSALPLLPAFLLGAASGIGISLSKNIVTPLIEQHLDRTNESHKEILRVIDSLSKLVFFVGLPIVASYLIGTPLTFSATLLTSLGSIAAMNLLWTTFLSTLVLIPKAIEKGQSLLQKQRRPAALPG